MAALLKRIRADGWTRAKADDSAKDERGEDDRLTEPGLPVLLDDAASRIVDEVVDEAMADIIAEHKAIARTLRRQFREELCEYDAMCEFFATFLDASHIAGLKAKDDAGKELRQYLQLALAHFKARSDAHAKLTMDGRMVVELERMAWQAESHAPSAWDDLLEDLNQPLAPRSLPANVVEFEKRVLRGGGKS